MKKLNKKKKFIVGILLVVLISTIGAVVYGYISGGNTTVKYFDRVQLEDVDRFGDNPLGPGIAPCEANKLSDKTLTFVFTEPFESLDAFEEAPIKDTIVATKGSGSKSLLPGRYGLYLQFEDGTKKLYSDLTLGNPSKTIPRDIQGPWYVTVNGISNNFEFAVSNPC